MRAEDTVQPNLAITLVLVFDHITRHPQWLSVYVAFQSRLDGLKGSIVTASISEDQVRQFQLLSASLNLVPPSNGYVISDFQVT